MQFKRMVIIGPGLVGGSLGLAARQRGLVGDVVGVGHRQSSIDKAVALGAIDSGSLDPAASVEGADLVVVATAVGLIPQMLRDVAGKLSPGCIVTDVGSTKSMIVREAESALRQGTHFVGAHPIAGSDRRGIDHARADLFVGSLCVLTPTDRTDREALARVERLWRAVGAEVCMLDAASHDAILARTSHLPHAVAAALVEVLEGGDAPFVGTGFSDATRIAGGDPTLWVDILMSNREAVLAAASRFQGQLDELVRALEECDAEAVRTFLARARDRRECIATRKKGVGSLFRDGDSQSSSEHPGTTKRMIQ